MTGLRSFDGIRPRLGDRCYVDPAACLIGKVVAGADCSFWPGVVVRGDVNEIHIGSGSNVQDCSVLHVTHDGPYSRGGLALYVGSDVTIGHRVVLHACTVGDRCLIGMGAIVMDGAVIEDDVFVAAGSLVTPGKHLKTKMLYRGSPATAARKLTTAELEMLHYSARHYVRLKDRYLGAPDDA